MEYTGGDSAFDFFAFEAGLCNLSLAASFNSFFLSSETHTQGLENINLNIAPLFYCVGTSSRGVLSQISESGQLGGPDSKANRPEIFSTSQTLIIISWRIEDIIINVFCP